MTFHLCSFCDISWYTRHWPWPQWVSVKHQFEVCGLGSIVLLLHFLFHVLVRRKQRTTPTPTQPLPASRPRPQVNVILTAQPNGIRNDKQPRLQGFSLTKWEGRCHSDKCIPIPKTLMIWVSPVTLTLTQIAKVIWEGDAREGFWEWVCPKREDTYIFVTAHL